MIINFGRVPYWIKGTMTDCRAPEFYYKMADKFTVMWIITNLTLQGILQMRTTCTLISESTADDCYPIFHTESITEAEPTTQAESKPEFGSTSGPCHSLCYDQAPHCMVFSFHKESIM